MQTFCYIVLKMSLSFDMFTKLKTKFSNTYHIHESTSNIQFEEDMKFISPSLLVQKCILVSES
jgi:hypothetical protein